MHKYRVFSKYEKFLKKIGVSLSCNARIIVSNYHIKPDGSGKIKKISRNDPCYCGPGKKFKKCCQD